MGPLKSKKTVDGSRVPRRFEPSSGAPPSPVLTEAGEDREPAGNGLETLGSLAAARRAELGFSRSDLARRMDVSEATIARIENGERQSTETLRRLAKALRPEEGKELLRAIEAELARRGVMVDPAASLPLRRKVARQLPESRRGRLLWGGLAIAALVAIVVIAAGAFSDSGGSPDPEPPPVVSAPPPAAVAVAPPEKPAKEKKAKQGDGKAAPVSDSQEPSSSDETSSDSESSSDEPSEPVSEPVVTPSPAPSSSQSTGRRPSLQHGINPGGP
jgi:transcriptional regulator with XRE-family HTH domain